MRVTNSMLVSNFLHNLETNRTKMDKLQTQLAKNSKYAHLSDDPIGVIYSQQARYRLHKIEMYQENVGMAQTWLASVETSTMDVNTVMKSAYEAAVSAATDVKSETDKKIDSVYIAQMRDHILTTLNSTFGDKYQYGGYNSTGTIKNGSVITPFDFTIVKEYAYANPYADENEEEIAFSANAGDSVATNINSVTTPGTTLLNTLGTGVVPASFAMKSNTDGSDIIFEFDGTTTGQQTLQDVILAINNETSHTGISVGFDTQQYLVDGNGDPILSTDGITPQPNPNYNKLVFSPVAPELTQVYVKNISGGLFGTGGTIQAEDPASARASIDPGDVSLKSQENHLYRNIWGADTSNNYPNTNTPPAYTYTEFINEWKKQRNTQNPPNAEQLRNAYLFRDSQDLTYNGVPIKIMDRLCADSAVDLTTAAGPTGIEDALVRYGIKPADVNGGAASDLALKIVDLFSNVVPSNTAQIKGEWKRIKEDVLNFDIGIGIPLAVTNNGVGLMTFNHGGKENVIFDLLDDLTFAVETGQGATSIGHFIDDLQAAQQHTLNVVAEIGGRTTRLDLMASRYEQDNINYTQMLSDAEDADEAELIMHFKMAEAVYNAALSTGARIIQPTLMDFLH